MGTNPLRVCPSESDCENSSFFSIAVLNTMTRSNQREERVYLVCTSTLEPITEEKQGRNSDRNLGQEPGRKAVYWLAQLTFLYRPDPDPSA